MRALAWALAAILLVVAIGGSLVAGVLLMSAIDSPGLLGLVVIAAAAVLGVTSSLPLIGRTTRRLLTMVAGAGVASLGTALLIGLVATEAIPAPQVDPRPAPNLRAARERGSLGIWVEHQPAQVIFVHGGPGAFTAGSTIDAFSRAMKAQGLSIAFYDQFGSGASDRADRVTDYSLDAAVLDLEQVRQSVGQQKVVLVAASYGGILASMYAKRFPAHVAGVVFVSPPRMTGAETAFDYSSTNRRDDGADVSLRLLVSQLMAERNPALAERFTSQEAMGRLGDAQLGPSLLAGMVCAGSPAPAVQPVGLNPYALARLQAQVRELPSAPIEALQGLSLPVVVLRGACDYVPRSQALAIAGKTGARVIDLGGKGHGITFGDQEAAALSADFAREAVR